jgi:VCBS repeat protein
MRMSLRILAMSGFLAAPGFAQTTFTSVNPFTNAPGAAPAIGYTERLHFGDIDGDGDLDCILADGGDFGNQVDRVWVNMGNLQAGTLGAFQDQSATRWTGIADDSRDVQLVDIDLDGDLDAYISNTSTVSAQSNRWVVNMGGLQGGTAGFFQDQTSTRWVGLAMGPGPGHPYQSSIPASLLAGLTPSSGFKDWSCECGFGDVDNDGDMDLLHATYGENFNGSAPTRIFLNDGAGFFSEFNPSGFQLAGSTILNTNPGLWCEGTQLNGTTNTTGLNCDIATHQLAAMFADLDNDLDLDIFLGSRNSQPRAYFNRLQETGTLIWRDMTAFVYTSASGNTGNYEQNLADLDNDSDLDAYLLNYAGDGSAFNDRVAYNPGTGQLTGFVTMASSGGDDNEPDFGDFDGDGDLDVAIAAFGSSDRIYFNNFVPSGLTGSFTLQANGGAVLPLVPGTTLDVDIADWDNDGDYDAAWAVDAGGAEVFMRNNLNTIEAQPPRVKRLEQAPNRGAGSAPTVVRTQVYDNSPLYQTGRDTTVIEVTVDGCPMADVPMHYSGGQLFRGTIPGSYVGNVVYSVTSTDEHGNTGFSTDLAGAPESKSYTGTGSTNATPYGVGTPGTGGLVPALGVNGPAAEGNAAFAFCVSSGKPSGAGFLFLSGLSIPTTDVLGINVNLDLGGLVSLGLMAIDANGFGRFDLPIPGTGAAGASLNFQYFGIDAAAPNGLGISSSNGLQVLATPPLP